MIPYLSLSIWVPILAGLAVEHLAKAFPRGAVPAPPGADRVLRACTNSDGVKDALVRWAFPGERDRKIGDVVDGYTRYLEQTGVGSKGADKVLKATMRRFFEELDEWTSSSDTVRDRTITQMHRQIDLCADLGGSVLVHGSPAQRRIDDADPTGARERGIDAFASVAEHAQQAGVIYCIEPLAPPGANFIVTVAQAVEQLRAGADLGGTTYRVHLDGHNQLPYLTGETDTSPRNFFFYVNDDADLVAVRFDNWKMVFLEQRVTGTLQVWAEPFVELRVPKIFNLRTDPYERADFTSNTYYDFCIRHIFLMAPAVIYVEKFVETFREYPPSQLPQGVRIQQALDKMKQGGGGL